MFKRIALLLAVLLLLAVPARAQTSCQSSYNVGCIGATVCFTATATSAQVLPQNLQRKYLLIQNEAANAPVYYAICNTPSTQTCTAVVNTNTIQLAACGGAGSANYEVSALGGGTGSSGSRVPTGAVAIISGGASITVCFTEQNG